MIELNSTISQIQNQRLAKCIKDSINNILEEYIHEPNNTATREIIKAKVLNLLNEAKEQFIKEHKLFIVGEQMVPADLLEPKVEIYPDRFNGTKLDCQFNKDAQAMVEEMYNDTDQFKDKDWYI